MVGLGKEMEKLFVHREKSRLVRVFGNFRLSGLKAGINSCLKNGIVVSEQNLEGFVGSEGAFLAPRKVRFDPGKGTLGGM